eukprot:1313248-Pleurochrysis_carterae.AAC.1
MSRSLTEAGLTSLSQHQRLKVKMLRSPGVDIALALSHPCSRKRGRSLTRSLARLRACRERCVFEHVLIQTRELPTSPSLVPKHPCAYE